jgi:hypothetical protein
MSDQKEQVYPKEREVVMQIGDEKPSQFDVLFGKGKGVQNHPGNRRYQHILDQYVKQFAIATSELQKSRIVQEVINVIYETEGQFLRQVGDTWMPVPNCEAYKKVWHALYDKSKKLKVWSLVQEVS